MADFQYYRDLVDRLSAYSAEHQCNGGITAEAADAIEVLLKEAGCDLMSFWQDGALALLMPIHPEYVERIFDGTKRFEFRRRLAGKPVPRIIVYATAPVSAVVGEVELLGMLSAPPDELWEQTKGVAGISEEKYRQYFAGRKTAYAYRLGKTTRYSRTKELREYGLSRAPQSSAYVRVPAHAAEHRPKDYKSLIDRLNAYSAEYQCHGGITAEAADAIEALLEELKCEKMMKRG